MKKKKSIVVWFLMAIAIVVILAILYRNLIHTGHSIQVLNPNNVSSELFCLQELRSGDAKLYDKGVITSVNGLLTFIDFEGKIIKQHKEINVSWLDVCDDSMIVYGNRNKEIGICRFDDECNIVFNKIILNIQETLGIDPAICKIEDEYYITVTHITGNVNNGDIQADNGMYSVRLYKSQNLKSWDFVSEVMACNCNLEDIDLNYYDNKLILTYEKEEYDKLDSTICIVYSKDKGKSWTESKVLVEGEGDNEPASFIETSSGYCLFYSSDIEEIGGTYETAKVYIKEFDQKMNERGKAMKLPLINQNGNLLYDVNFQGERMYFLFTEKYISQSNLILECIRANEI